MNEDMNRAAPIRWLTAKLSPNRLNAIGTATVLMWLGYWLDPRNKKISGIYEIAIICVYGLLISILLWFGIRAAASAKTNKRELIELVLSIASIIILFFAILYLEFEVHGFNAKMTKVNAFYFSLGTFTTAGTGTIAPLTSQARMLVSMQYVIDLIYIGVVVTLAVSRFVPADRRSD